LTACHLRCGYCDSRYAFTQGQTIPLEDVVARALAFGDPLVEITGGEPLLQPEVYPLMSRLADAGRTVLLETSGTLDTSHVDPRVRVILDLKTPGSGEVAANVWGNMALLRAADEVKFVLCDRADFDWAVEQVKAYSLTSRCSVIFSPSFHRVLPTELALWVLESHLAVRVQIQLHKILWDSNARGV